MVTIESGHQKKKNSTLTGRARPGWEIVGSIRHLGKGMGTKVMGVRQRAGSEPPVVFWRKTIKRIRRE